MPKRRRSHSKSPDSPDSPLPSQTYHSPILPGPIPLPALFESAASGAHYTGGKVDGRSDLWHRRSSASQHHPHTELNHGHHRVLDDLTELYCCRPTLEIFERSWNMDAEFEVRVFLSLAARWVLTAAAFLKNPVCKSSGYKEYAAQVCLRSMFITYDHPYFTSGLHWFVLQLL